MFITLFTQFFPLGFSEVMTFLLFLFFLLFCLEFRRFHSWFSFGGIGGIGMLIIWAGGLVLLNFFRFM